MIKQVIVMRTDLNMRKGKMCAQAAHASMKVFLDHSLIIQHEDVVNDCLEVGLWPDAVEWLNGAFTKIVVGCSSEQELRNLYSAAKEADLPCSLIEDNGATEFHGQKTATCIAIGPAKSEQIDPFTRDLKLL